MLSKWLKPNKTVLAGIDISTTAVKLLVLRKDNKAYTVVACTKAPVPPGALVAKEIKNPSAVAQAVEKAIAAVPFKIHQAAIALADSSVISKVVQVDASLSAAEIEAWVMLEADKQLPYPIDEIRLDYEIIEPVISDPQKLKILFVAARQEIINTYVDVVNQAGLAVSIVDIESYAVWRAWYWLCDRKQIKKDRVAILDIGAQRTALTIVTPKGPVFQRIDAFGGERLTKLIAEQYAMSESAAEIAKLDYKALPNYSTAILAPFTSAIVQQARRGLQFFTSTTESNTVSQIVLAGGTAHLPELAKQVAQEMGIPTLIADPFAHMQCAPTVNAMLLQQAAPNFLLSCGLALRSFTACVG